MASNAGPLRLRFSGQEAVCFFPTRQQAQVEEILSPLTGWRIAATQLKNFDTEPMSALYLKSQRKLFDIRDRLVQKDIRITEADLKPTDRFLMERFITASVSIEGSLNENDGFSDVTPSDLRATQYRPQLNAVSVDIETDYHASTLYSIGIYSDIVSLVYMVGLTEDSIEQTDDGGNLELYQLNSEREVISAFVKKIADLDPDVIMGWNIVKPNHDSELINNLPNESRFYFVHSYYVDVDNQKDSILKADYSITFDAAIQNDNVYGVQFHPEKSHKFGMQLLKNFVQL